MHIAIDVAPSTPAAIQVKGNKDTLNIQKSPSMAGFEGVNTMTRDGIIKANWNEKLWVTSVYGSVGTGAKQPYWSGFRFDNIYAPLILFSVLQTSSYTSDANTPMKYDSVSHMV